MEKSKINYFYFLTSQYVIFFPGEFTPIAFLKSISHTSDSAVGRTLQQNDEDDIDISSDEEIPDVNQGEMCSICLQQRLETYTLVPCGHSSLCMNCANHLMNNGLSCHMCRQRVGSVLRIFLWSLFSCAYMIFFTIFFL